MKLQYVPISDIGLYWDKIKPSLENMARNWRVEDAYCELKIGHSDLFVFTKDNYYIGYIITQRHGDTLHVWAAYSDTNNVLIDGFKEIKKLASEYNLRHITFKSYRKGWDKIAPQMGFKKEVWTYDL